MTAEIDYIVYDGSNDPICKNTLCIYESGLATSNNKILVKHTSAIIDYGFLIIAKHEYGKNFLFYKKDNCYDFLTDFRRHIVYNDLCYRWYDDLTLYVSSSIERKEAKCHEHIAAAKDESPKLPLDPLTLLVRIIREYSAYMGLSKLLDPQKISYGRNVLDTHNIRGIRWTRNYVDIHVIIVN